jgi:hypothetical protein
VLAIPTAASATTGPKPVVCKATFSHHPENSSPVWAYDTFTRITLLTPAGAGTWKAHIADIGHFTTVPGAKSDSGDVIQNKVTGVFAGSGDYTVTSPNGPRCFPSESYDGTGDPPTAAWPKHYFGGSSTTTGIDPWHWEYRTCREHMSEDSKAGTQGHMSGLKCLPKPSGSPTPSTTPTSPSGDGSGTPTAVPSGAPQTGDGSSSGGANTALMAAGGLVVALGGGTGLLMWRRRNQH